MPDPTQTQDVRIEHELHACPQCPYEQGFHVAFVREGQGLRLELICPSCGSRFNPGIKLQ